MSLPARALALGSLVLLACGDDPGGQPAGDAGVSDAEQPDAEQPDAEPPPPTSNGIDILFVVNDSQGMATLQERVGQALPGFFDALAAAEGAALDLHVGVATTSIFMPSPALCSGSPPGGALYPGACLTSGVFASTTEGNFTTSVGAAAQCMLALGDFGCPFEQPLEAMRQALNGSVAANAGFLRPDALLVVVFVTDEDDCSSSDPALFDQFGSSYGPLGSFRCFEHGVRCDEAVASAGAKTNCVPAEDDGVLSPVGDYVAFLESLKSDPRRVIVGGLTPAAAPVNVIGSGNPFLLQPLCQALSDSTGVQTWPSVRMHALAEQLDSQLGDFCAADFAAQLAPLAQRIADAYVEE
jgi:hypothetical protein